MICCQPIDVAVNKALIERFMDSLVPEPNSGCWLWEGHIYGGGYGQMLIAGKSIAAHRLSWLIHQDEDPGQLYVLHKCDNRCCVNPQHLRLGTQKENIQDAVSKGRWNRPQPIGEGNPAAKLDTSKVRWLRNIVRSGEMTARQAAKHLGVCRATAEEVLRGDRWGHIDPDYLKTVRRRQGSTHCINGHALTPENTYSPPSRPTRRHCRTCQREGVRRYQARKAMARCVGVVR